jgi:hypothetical protein
MSNTTQEERVSLQNLARGAVVERFDDELRKVLDNIIDPNTTLATRKITITVAIKPDKDRDFGGVDVTCKSTLAPASPLGTKIFIGRDKSGAVASEVDPRQHTLPGVADGKMPENVSELRPAASGGGK